MHALLMYKLENSCFNTERLMLQKILALSLLGRGRKQIPLNALQFCVIARDSLMLRTDFA